MSWYDNFKTGTKDYLVKSKSKTSSFWYDDYDTSFDYMEQFGSYQKKDLDAYKKTHNLYKLASVRRAISNFVQIVTGKSIPVSFATKSESKTDGEKVILSADVDDNFDVSVGLALHEGSHIVLSDFKMLGVFADIRRVYSSRMNNLEYQNKTAIANGETPLTSDQIYYEIKSLVDTYGGNYKPQLSEIFLSNGKIGSKGFVTEEVLDIVQGLTNWVEDRRIDNYIFNSAPGYRDYYISMYEHYFNDKIVTKGIKSDEYTDETWESYMFRIINLNNPETTLGKLKGLRNIYRMLDLKNISRLKTTTDALNLAIDVVAEILRYVPMEPSQFQPQNGNGKGEGESGDGEVEIDDISDMELGEDGDGEQGQKVKLSDTAKKQLDKKIQKQKDFLNDKVKKKQLTKQESDKLDTIQESGTELTRVGSDYTNQDGTRVGKGVDCIVVKKLTPALLESEDFPFTHKKWNADGINTPYTDEVKRGTIMGNLLGKKLQIRSESRETIFSRLKKGKIDGRMVASLGYDNENVFYSKEVDQFKKANLHISIDYSGSMSGDKLRRCIVSTVAIVKACEMARNINVQVSIRSTENGGRSLPYVAVVHDSRRDSFKQFAYYMSALSCTNTTPEGLCFEAIMKELIPSTNDTDSYFLNFSDGQPTYSISHGNDEIHYSGNNAAEHTNKQVKKMMGNGINILSYFITECSHDRFEHSSDWQVFKKCYGNDAKYVNVENVFEVAKTMNELFLKKS
jgi:hypothetical protein